MRALLSVYDKAGIVELARDLRSMGWDLISSGGTAQALRDADLAVTDVAELTGFPAILGHRVVTLHPKVHGGILADRRNPDHQKDMAEYGIDPLDLVVSNLYPFGADTSTFEHGATRAEELIDIGGPAMIRAAAKNFRDVGILTQPSDYQTVIDELKTGGVLSDATKLALARKAFAHTAAYDASIVSWFDRVAEDPLPPTIHLALERVQDLRYGENPHQTGARYREIGTTSWWDDVEQHGGMALSYLNLFDADAAWGLANDLAATFGRPAVAIIKHANPCGAAVADSLPDAYQRAFECDERSAFGGIVALSHPVDDATVERMVAAAQADVVIAPGYGDERDRSAHEEAQEHPPPHRDSTNARSSPDPPAHRLVAGAGRPPLRHHPGRLARRHQARAHGGRVGRRRAGLAARRLGEEQLDRPREGRHGLGDRRRPAEPRRGRSDRRRQGRRPGQGRGLRQRRLLPVPRRDRGGRRRRRRRRDPARRLRQGRGHHRQGRRARPGHGLHQRAPLPALVASPRYTTSAEPPEGEAKGPGPVSGALQSKVMSAVMMPGGPVADAVFADLEPRIEKLIGGGHTPGLATVLIGDDEPSARYVGMKTRKAEELGCNSPHVHLPADATTADAIAAVQALNADPAVDAMLVQYPGPPQIDFDAVLLAVDADKDVDGMHPTNVGRLALGIPGPVACTPAGIEALLAHYEVPVAGRDVVIVGRGVTIGRPLSILLSQKRPTANAAVTVVHTGVLRLGVAHPTGRHPDRGRGRARDDPARARQAGGRGGGRWRPVRGTHAPA